MWSTYGNTYRLHTKRANYVMLRKWLDLESKYQNLLLERNRSIRWSATPKMQWIKLNIAKLANKVQVAEPNCILCKFHFALFYSVFWKQTLEILERAATAASVCLEPLLATTLARSQDCSNSSYKPFQLSRRRQTWRQSSKVWTSKEDKSFWLKKSILTRNMTWKPLILIHNPLTFGITIINPWEMLSSHLFCQHYYKVWVPWVPSSCSFLWILLNFFWAKACTFRGSCRSLTRS